ncbi:MAG: hypothetical protein AMJ66_03120 [Betaproteobacteria bacterium SG8_40]|nr:MAG: hypothetical protein AMJ66_03120 [Betaproteobacteria bacterium SG8_40]
MIAPATTSTLEVSPNSDSRFASLSVGKCRRAIRKRMLQTQKEPVIGKEHHGPAASNFSSGLVRRFA